MKDFTLLPGGGIKVTMTEREFKRTKTFWHKGIQYRVEAATNFDPVTVYGQPTGEIF